MNIFTRLTPILPVNDVLAERAFYNDLGFATYLDSDESYPETVFAALESGRHILFGLLQSGDFDVSGSIALLHEIDDEMDQYAAEKALAMGRPRSGELGHGELNLIGALRWLRQNRSVRDNDDDGND